MEWEGSTFTAIPPPSASDVAGQHSKTEGLNFQVAFYIYLFILFTHNESFRMFLLTQFLDESEQKVTRVCLNSHVFMHALE